MDLQELIKLSEDVHIPSSEKAPVINIHVGSKDTNSSTSLVDAKSYETNQSAESKDLSAREVGETAKEVEEISKSWENSNSSVDEVTAKQIKDHLTILRGLLSKAKGIDAQVDLGRGEIKTDMGKVQETVNAMKERSLESLQKLKEVNKYAPASLSSTPRGILGVGADTNDGSGTSMNAHAELAHRLTHRSMMGNPGLEEVRKIRSQDPETSYG